MATEKAPVAVTGSAGFEFHDRVAARCLLDLLLGRAFAAHLGAVVKIKWEVRESGQFGDDLVLSCRRDGVEREVGLSLKSDRQVTGNGFPSDFRDLAWEQWDGRAGATAIRGTENMIGLVVGELAGGVEAAWNALAAQIGESRSALDRVLARLQPATDRRPRCAIVGCSPICSRTRSLVVRLRLPRCATRCWPHFAERELADGGGRFLTRARGSGALDAAGYSLFSSYPVRQPLS